MIILLRLRNLTLFALFVLSMSFIYIGYVGFNEESQMTEQVNKVEEKSVNEVTVETFQSEQENPLLEFDPLQNADTLKNKENFFAEFRIKRDKGRDAQIEILRELVNNPNSSSEIRNKAQTKLYNISENIALEVKAENLLKAKGYQETVVVVEGNNITVVIENNDLQETDMMRISDLVKRATGFKLEQIVIIPK